MKRDGDHKAAKENTDCIKMSMGAKSERGMLGAAKSEKMNAGLC